MSLSAADCYSDEHQPLAGSYQGMIRGESVQMFPGCCTLRDFLLQTNHLVRGSDCAHVCVIKPLVIIVVQMTSGWSLRLLFHPSQLEGHATEVSSLNQMPPMRNTPLEMSRSSIVYLELRLPPCAEPLLSASERGEETRVWLLW